jgi:hypothetical protein
MRLESRIRKVAKLAASAKLSDYAFTGKWQNELGSVMDLDVVNGLVNGTYNSAVSATGAPVTGKIKGFAKADILALVVRWNIPAASMTSWVGQVERRGGDRIRTLWHLVQDVPDQDEPQELWASVLTGTDLFRRA